jgi:hypothetical protein
MMVKHLRPEFIEHYKLWETFGDIIFPTPPEDYQHKKRVFKKWCETQPGRWNQGEFNEEGELDGRSIAIWPINQTL